MIQKILVVFIIFISIEVSAQQATSSPYSFFGIGALNFKGTTENRSMGSISMYSDSIHLNLQNPSGYAHLKLVNFSVSGSHKYTVLKTPSQQGYASSTSIDYISLGFPIGEKLGAGLGILPLTAVGYNLESASGEATVQNTGKGGMNKVYMSLGYALTSQFSLGIDLNYNFGNIENKTLLFQEDIQFATRETNSSSLSGFSLNFGATYKTMITNKLEMFSSVTFTPETNLDSENLRQFASVFIPNENIQVDVDIRDVDVPDSKLKLPAQYSIGLGIGHPRKWFIGGEYTGQKVSNFSNRSFDLDNVSFENTSRFKLGGFYIPNHNALSGYWNKVAYRGGMRYEDTGLIINGEKITEFGISFGVGLPMGRMFSNVNLGIELGSRGTENAGLVKETFFNTFISLSLNDKWFVKTLYD